MKKMIVLMSATAFLMQCVGVQAEQNNFEVVDTISGSSLKFINIAIPVVNSFGLDLNEYKITVVVREGKPGIIFEDLKKAPGQYGSPPGGRPGFEVRFNEDGSRIIKANFSR